MPLPFGFRCPEIATMGDSQLRPLIAAAIDSDPVALTERRARFADEADSFDRFVAGIRILAASDPSAASREFAGAQPMTWLVPASVLDALALVAAGELRSKLALLNQIGDVIRSSGVAGANTDGADRALREEGLRCPQIAKATFPAANGPLEITSLFRYVVGYRKTASFHETGRWAAKRSTGALPLMRPLGVDPVTRTALLDPGFLDVVREHL